MTALENESTAHKAGRHDALDVLVTELQQEKGLLELARDRFRAALRPVAPRTL